MNETNAKFLILGHGQIGRALAKLLGEEATVIGRSRVDFSNTEVNFKRLIEEYQPQTILNAIAYTAVDLAESTGRMDAFQINADAVGALAKAASTYGIPLVHYSTDYVFDGNAHHAYREEDATHPLNVYGASKLSGEQHIVAAGGDYLIFRISWVYDETGKNFLNTMLRLGTERDTLSVVNDQIGAPCYAGDIAEATMTALNKAQTMQPFPKGIYHMTSSGATSWHGFAESIFQHARHIGQEFKVQTIRAISTSEYPTPATRPLNSRMNCEKLQSVFGITMPTWQAGLARCLRNKYAGGNTTN